MPMFLKAGGIIGSVVALIAILIVFLKTVIGFIAFLTGAIKLLIILAFVALIVGVGIMVLKGFKERRRSKE